MEWIPQDTDFLTVFGAVLAVGATVLGLVVGLGQFSGAARARRTIEWTSEALSIETDPARQNILVRLKLRAQGYLIAAQYVPWWRFSEVISWTLLSPAVVILTSSRDTPTSTITLGLLVGTTNLTLVIRRGIRLYAERMRVAYQFTAGGSDVEPVKVSILAQMEGGTRREFLLGLVCSIAIMGTGGLLAWALVEGRGSFVWFWVLVGGAACWGAFQLAHNHAREWARRVARLPEVMPER